MLLRWLKRLLGGRTNRVDETPFRILFAEAAAGAARHALDLSRAEAELLRFRDSFHRKQTLAMYEANSDLAAELAQARARIEELGRAVRNLEAEKTRLMNERALPQRHGGTENPEEPGGNPGPAPSASPCPACGATAGPVTISGGAKGERNKPQCARCGTPWEGGA